MTDRIEEIRERLEAATPIDNPSMKRLVDQNTAMRKLAMEDIPWLLDENERQRVTISRLTEALEVVAPVARWWLDEYGFGMDYNSAVELHNHILTAEAFVATPAPKEATS